MSWKNVDLVRIFFMRNNYIWVFFAASGDGRFWLSSNDISRPAGQFQWPDKSPVDSSLWAVGEPDSFGHGNETCLVLTTATWKLFDKTFSIKYYFIAELSDSLYACLLTWIAPHNLALELQIENDISGAVAKWNPKNSNKLYT